MKILRISLFIITALIVSHSTQAQLVVEKAGYEIINTFPIPEELRSQLGTILFSPDGNTVYVIEDSEDNDAAVSSASVVRGFNGNVVSFGPFTEVFAFPNIDTGLEFGPGTDTLFFRVYQEDEEQEEDFGIGQRLSNGTVEVTPISGYDPEYGGLAFIPGTYSANAGNIVSSDYNNGYTFFMHKVTPDGDGSFTVTGAGTLYADFSNAGANYVNDLIFVTSGPMSGNVIAALYDSENNDSLVYFPVGADGMPLGGTDVSPQVFASGYTGAWGVAIDPVTDNIWMIDYSETNDIAMTQIGEATTRSELKNLSTRADVGTGADTAIAGFIINTGAAGIAGGEDDGKAQKCVVVRGRGPSMNVSGVPLLMDPNLTLYSGQTIIDANDSWMDQAVPANKTIIEDLGLAPPDFREAALYKCLEDGAYTAFLRGGNGGTGVGIVEVFDADDGSAILENISTRTRVGSGPLVTIGGFIIDRAEDEAPVDSPQGDDLPPPKAAPMKILVRGRGPSVGVPDGVTRLNNPKLRLYQLLPDNTNVLLMENDNWGDAPNAAEIAASGQAPGDANEAAILMWLDAGVYTGIVDGVFGATGSGIIEVIDLTGGED